MPGARHRAERSIPARAGAGLRLSPSNFVYNHIGHFAAANHAACKAMFLGGVTRRFPGLNIVVPRRRRGLGLPCFTATCSAIGKSAAARRSRRSTRATSTAALLMELAEKYGGDGIRQRR